jgi:hypothetical protein
MLLKEGPREVSDRLSQSGKMNSAVKLKARVNLLPLSDARQDDMVESLADCLRKFVDFRLAHPT